MKEALRGKRDAVAELVQCLVPAIQARITTVLLRSGRHNRSDVEDLTQETLLTLIAAARPALTQWNPELGLSLRGYAALIAERRAISWLRTRQAEPFDPTWLETVSEVFRDQALDGQVHARATLAALAHYLHETLSAQGLEMFYRLYTWEQSPAQAAEETGSSLEAVYQWKSRLKVVANEFVASLERASDSRLPEARVAEPIEGL